MKLIRLATDNDAKFDANFDTPINIAPNSSLALQNISLEREFPVFEIGANNETVNVKYPIDAGGTGNESTIPRIVVDEIDEKDTLLQHLSQALNGTLNIHSVATGGAATEDPTGPAEWRVRENPKNQNPEIRLELTPLVTPFEQLPSEITTESVFQEEAFITTLNRVGGGTDIGDRFHLATGQAKTTDRTYLVELTTGLNLCRGGGIISVQIEDSADNGLGGGATATNNGFGIGICLGVDSIPKTGGRLLDADVDYEVYYNRHTANYSAIQSKGAGRVDTGVPPLKVRLAAHADATTHDVMGIQINENTINGFVAKDDGDPMDIFTIATLTDEQKLAIQQRGIKAYMYFNDDNTGIKICNSRVTVSPYVEEDNGAFGGTGDLCTFASTNGGRDHVVNLADNLLEKLPFVFNPQNEVDLGGPRNEAVFDINLTLDPTVQRFLGRSVTQIILPTDNLQVFEGSLRLVSDKQLSFTFNDYYILESLSLPLDSYNAVPDERLSLNVPDAQALKVPLKGDRKNILATIPLQQGVGEVTYETNTPIFIDIRNLQDTNIRNLKFRVLDKNFKEIKTQETTNMTLLIKGPNE